MYWKKTPPWAIDWEVSKNFQSGCFTKIVIEACFRNAWKVSKYGVFSGPYFRAFGPNTERYFVSLRIQPECGKIRTRKNSVLDTSHTVPKTQSSFFLGCIANAVGRYKVNNARGNFKFVTSFTKDW